MHGSRGTLGCLVLLGLSLAACGGSDGSADSDSTTAASADASAETAAPPGSSGDPSSTPGPSGTAVTVVLAAEPVTLDPGDNGVVVVPVQRNILQTLVSPDPETGELVPELATSWEQIEPTTWRFTLRDGVSFSNGEPFDAEAVVQTIERILDPEKNLPTSQFLTPMTASAPDARTVDVSTEEPNPILPNEMFFVPISAPVATGDSASVREPIGTGPYVLDSWESGNSIVLELNETYWGERPSVEQMTFVWRAEPSVRASMVKNGEADIAVSLSADDDAGDSPRDVVIPEGVYFRIDTACPALADIRVRRAINLAIDRETIVNALFGGLAVPANGQIITPSTFGHNSELEATYDLAEAKALIEEAVADGVPMSSLTVVSRPNMFPRAGCDAVLDRSRIRRVVEATRYGCVGR
jgi:peptide/nickel transport system substrate-binding protein